MDKKGLPYIARGDQRIEWFRSVTFNIDNGSGTTVDDVIFADLDKDVHVVHVRPVYVEATDTSGAGSATYSLGSTAGGVDVVAAVALEVLKSVGDAGTAGVIASSRVAAGGTLFARHTGIAATDAGQYYLQVGVISVP